MNKKILNLSLFVLFLIPLQLVYSQNLIGFSVGNNFAKFFETKKVQTNYESKYPFKSGYFAALNFETDKEKHNFSLNVLYGHQKTEFDFTSFDKFGDYYSHYEYKFQNYQFDINYIFKLKSQNKSTFKLFFGPSISKRVNEETVTSYGSFPQPTVQYDTTGQAVYMYINKYWEKNNFESNDLPRINIGFNFGFSVTFPITIKTNLVLENKNTLFLNDQSLQYGINLLGLLNNSISVGLRFKI
jgi:hypothetical protein